MRNWLVGSHDSNTLFGGLPGEPAANHGKWFFPNGRGPGRLVANAVNISGISSNTLMPTLRAEFWKRLAMNKLDAITWLKNADYAGSILPAIERTAKFFTATASFSMTDEDLRVLRYGFVNSSQNGGLQLGATQHGEYIDTFGSKSKLDTLKGIARPMVPELTGTVSLRK